MITTINSANTLPHIVKYVFLVLRTFKIYFLSNFQIYSRVLLTILYPIIEIYSRGPEAKVSPFLFSKCKMHYPF